MKEQQRRIAAFDSVVRSIDTDSAYKLWHATLTASDAKRAQQQVECEYDRLMMRYGIAGYVAIGRMEDTLWHGTEGALVGNMNANLEGMALPVSSAACGRGPTPRAPNWLANWYVYELPRLPPSPDDTGHTR